VPIVHILLMVLLRHRYEEEGVKTSVVGGMRLGGVKN